MSRKCIHCQDFALGETYPPLCPVHLDLDVLVEFALSRGAVPSVELLQAYYLAARQNSDEWVVSLAQIAELLPGYLAAKKIALPATETGNAINRTTPAGVNQ